MNTWSPWFFLIEQDLVEPQTKLLQYVIAQPYSRDVICTMLGLNKQVCFFESLSSIYEVEKKNFLISWEAKSNTVNSILVQKS